MPLNSCISNTNTLIFAVLFNGNKNTAAMTNANKEIVDLPGGMTCFKEFEAEALKIYDDAYERAFDGYNYDFANAKASLALAQYLND